MVKLGLAALKPKFDLKGWNTMSNLCFGCGYSPKGPDDADFQREIFVPLFGDAADPLKPVVRKLYFEAFSMTSNDMARRSNRNDEDEKPKKLPAAERSERLTELQAKLTGLKLEGEYEPSHILVDKYVEMEDTEVLRFIPWEELTKRDLELKGVKKDEFFKEDSSGFMKRHYKEVEMNQPIRDLLHLKYALQRRGLAMHMARLLSFQSHEDLVNLYFLEMSRDPLEGHEPTSMEQIRRADKEIFMRLAQETRGGLTELADPEGIKFPLDNLIPKVMFEHRVTALLLPLQVSGRVKDPDLKRANQSEVDRLRAEVKKLKDNLYYNKEEYPKGKGKGKWGKDKGKKGEKDTGSNRNMPKELAGMSSVFEGKPICFNYNMKKGCQDKACSRQHVCAFIGCGSKSHPCHKCPMRV